MTTMTAMISYQRDLRGLRRFVIFVLKAVIRKPRPSHTSSELSSTHRPDHLPAGPQRGTNMANPFPERPLEEPLSTLERQFIENYLAGAAPTIRRSSPEKTTQPAACYGARRGTRASG